MSRSGGNSSSTTRILKLLSREINIATEKEIVMKYEFVNEGNGKVAIFQDRVNPHYGLIGGARQEEYRITKWIESLMEVPHLRIGWAKDADTLQIILKQKDVDLMMHNIILQGGGPKRGGMYSTIKKLKPKDLNN